MVFSLVLALVLVQAPVPPQPPTLAEAVQLAEAGRHGEALAAFQARVAVNPDDHEARLWIAELHERMGNPRLAEAVYRSVWLEDADSVAAMTGVARTVLARGDPAAALAVLERAEKLAPENEEVLALTAQAHRRAGREREALSYLERAAAVAPAEAQQTRLQDARMAFQHHVEIRGVNEQFSGSTAASNGGDLLLDVRVGDALRVRGFAQVQRKFRVQDERGGAGFEWTPRSNISLVGQALIGPDNLVIPQGDYLGAVVLRSVRADWTMAVRYFDFAGAWVSSLSPSVKWFASDRTTLSLGYTHAVNESSVLDQEISHHGYIRGTYRLQPRLSVGIGYAAGVEDWDRMSIDRVGDVRAHTASAAVRVDLQSLTSVMVGYERQWRKSDVTMGRITLSLAQRF
jgi:YaiO family outer membrane protein